MRPMEMSPASMKPARPAALRAVPVLVPRPVRLSEFTLLRREPVRPEHLRGPDFADRYDNDTLIYEAVRTGRGNEVMLFAPPLNNLEEGFERARLLAMPSRTRLRPRITRLDRHTRITVDIPDGTTHLALHAPFGETRIEIAAPRLDMFAGLRVMLTLSQNNRLPWIRDWICYHRDVHGLEAVLIYDNASTEYTAGELAAMLASIPGLKAACVVAWPFRYGPQGLGNGAGWDSDYCQLAALEHARWSFLREARSVLNADIDELVITPDGRSIFGQAETSFLGIRRYYGRWAYGIEGITPRPSSDSHLRHRDFTVAARPRMRRRLGILNMDAAACFAKWVCVPAKCPDKAQWHPHTIRHMPAARLYTNKVHFLHFREISNSWKYARNDRQTFDPALFEHHAKFIANVAKVDWDT